MYRLTGLGDTATVQPTVCVPFASWSDPFCLAALIDGEYAPGYTAAVNPSITQAYVAGSVPVVPPSQAVIDAQSAQDTADQIIAQSQANAIAAATAAAAAQAAANAPAKPPACVADSSSFACWLSNNSTMLIVGGCVVVGLFLLKELR